MNENILREYLSPENNSQRSCESPVAFSASDFSNLLSKSKTSGETTKPLPFSATVFASPEDVALSNKKFGMSSLSIKVDIGRFAPSFSACDLPVDCGPTKMKYRLNGISCCLCDIKLPVLATNAVEVKMQGTR